MMTRFKPLFSLGVRHDYYGGACPDIGFIVPERVTRILRGAGMLTKVVDGTLHAVFPAGAAGDPARSISGKALRIGVVTRDPDFANITDGFAPSSGALHYRNRQLATVLDDPPTAIDLRAIEPALWRDSVFALVEIVVDPAWYREAPSFQIRCRTRTDIWRYYVIVKGFSSGEVDQLAVQEQSSGAPGSDPATFEKVAPTQLTADEKSRADALASDGARVLVFRSAAGVPLRMTGTKQLQLVRNSEAVIERLPQPGKRHGTADLIVQVSKSKP